MGSGVENVDEKANVIKCPFIFFEYCVGYDYTITYYLYRSFSHVCYRMKKTFYLNSSRTKTYYYQEQVLVSMLFRLQVVRIHSDNSNYMLSTVMMIPNAFTHSSHQYFGTISLVLCIHVQTHRQNSRNCTNKLVSYM